MTVFVDAEINSHDTRPPPAFTAGNRMLNAFDVISGPYSVTARRQLEAINRLIRLREESRLKPRCEGAGEDTLRYDLPERLLEIYAKHPEALETPPGGADVVAWIREFRGEISGG